MEHTKRGSCDHFQGWLYWRHRRSPYPSWCKGYRIPPKNIYHLSTLAKATATKGSWRTCPREGCQGPRHLRAINGFPIFFALCPGSSKTEDGLNSRQKTVSKTKDGLNSGGSTRRMDLQEQEQEQAEQVWTGRGLQGLHLCTPGYWAAGIMAWADHPWQKMGDHIS
jgi:hypothetical protein